VNKKSSWSSTLHLFFHSKCPLHLHAHSIPVSHHIPLNQVLWQLRVPPSSLFNNHGMTFLIPALKNHHLCVTQASFHVVTHRAHASIIARLLKTKALLRAASAWEGLHMQRCSDGLHCDNHRPHCAVANFRGTLRKLASACNTFKWCYWHGD
jgi:hypothetical protein